MSLGAKASGKGGNKAKHNHVSHKSEKSQRAQSNTDAGDEAGGFRLKVQQLMEMTRRSEEEVCSALHDCDQDLAKACDMLFEEADRTQGQWQTKEKKKKKTANTANTSGGGGGAEEEWGAEGAPQGGSPSAQQGGNAGGAQGRDHRPPRGRSSSRPYRGSRGGGDYHTSESDPSDMSHGGRGARRGRGGGRGGGARGGRGGGRGGGVRGGPPRGGSRGGPPSSARINYNVAVAADDEVWEIPGLDTITDTFPAADDWDNEEWSGSLADTKVFTPSAPIITSSTNSMVNSLTNSLANSQLLQEQQQQQQSLLAEQLLAVNSDQLQQQGLQQQTSMPDGVETHNSLQQENSNDFMKQSVVETAPSPSQDPAVYGYSNSTHHIPKAQSPVVSGTLSAAQSQYLSQLTQKSEALKDTRNLLNSQVYSTNYGVYGTSDLSSQRKPLQRVRVPPPSKIPSSAVEMPGEQVGGNSSVGLLDVQFGALDFTSENNSFLSDTTTSDSYATNTPTSLEHVLDNGSQQSAPPTSMPTAPSPQSSAVLPNDVSQYTTPTSTQMLTSESLSAAVAVEQQQAAQQAQQQQQQAQQQAQQQNSASVSSSAGSQQHYASSQPSSVRTPHSTPSTHQVSQLTTHAGLESQLTSASKSSSVASEVSVQQSVYSSYPGQATAYTAKQPSYHPTHHTYQTNPYSQVNSTGASFTAASSAASGNVSASYPPSNTLNQYQPINTYQNSSSVSVYGNSGLYTASNVPYNSYQTLQTNSNKISSNVKDSQYDTTVTTANNSLSNTPSGQSTQSSTKISTTSGGKSSGGSSGAGGAGVGSAGVGGAGGGHVGAVMGQYIMGQPFYQQPLPAYTYEEMQMLQQRLPHHMTGYYDMGYTSSRAPPDASIPSFASLASDARFSRAGDAASPSQQGGAAPLQAAGGAGAGGAGGAGGVPSQGAGAGGAGAQQQQQQQSMVAAQPYTAYFYGASMVPAGSFQAYGTPPLYPMATAGGTASSSYGSGKGVGGGYVGAAYGAPQPQQQPYEQQQPPQQQQDYKSGGYTTTQQSSGVKQGGVSNSTSAATELNNSMYGAGKAHVSLNKVNSYEKAAYHSATPPPPFGLGGAGGGVAGVGAGYAAPQHLYIQHGAMAPPPTHQQMDARVTNSHRRDNGTNSSRSGASGQNKQGAAKQGYSPSYWNAN